MHRRDGQRRSTIACRQPAGFAMGRSRYSRRTAVLSTGSVAGCRLKFFKAEGLLICRTDALKNRGNRKNPLRARAEDFCFSGAGVKGNAMPIVRGAGGETSGAGQGRQTLVWVQGRRALLRVEGGKPRPVGLLFTAALTGYYLPKMSHKNPGFTRQGQLKNQQNCKKRKPWFQEKRRKHSETESRKLARTK